MNKITTSLICKFVVVCCIFYFFWLILSIPIKGPVGENFPDSTDYMVQSRISFSEGFLAPNPVRWFSPRPFTIPLMYKMVNSDPHSMIFFQKLFYCLSVLIFIFSFAQFFRNWILKTIIYASLFYYFTWWNIVGWSTVILSECFSMSYMMLWFSTVLFYFYYKTKWSVVLLIFISILFSFTRDTWPYFILFFFLTNSFIQFFSEKKSWKPNVILILFSVCLYMVQSYTIKKGERTTLPVFNSIAGRVSQSDEYINWFKKEGMPLGDQLVKDFRGYDLNINPGKGIVYKRYDDGTYPELLAWSAQFGKEKYQKFILCHLSYFFLTDQTSVQMQRIFAYNVQNYYNGPEHFFHNGDNFLPVFSPYYTLVMALFCFYLWYRYRRMHYAFPVLLTLVTVFNAFLTYNADTLEVERHMFITLILEELIGIIASIITFNYLIRWLKIKRKIKTRRAL